MTIALFVARCAVLAVTQDPKPTLMEVRQFLTDEGIARLMLPDSLAFLEQLPMTAVGKVARQQLVTQLQQAQSEPEGV